MPAALNRLGPRLILSTVGFLLLVAIATALLVTQGFRQTQDDATTQSSAGLAQQGQEALAELTQREAQITSARLLRGARAAEYARDFFLAMAQQGGSVPGLTFTDLERNSVGNFTDLNPNRISDILVQGMVQPDPRLDKDLRQTAVLDTLFPTLLAHEPDAAALYYIGHQGYSRYYPPIDLAAIIPPDFPVLEMPFYAMAAPQANSERRTIWTPPYLDPAGQGTLVTVSTPVYEGHDFRGIMAMDLKLDQLIAHLNTLRPTEHGYAFLVDQDGKLVAGPQGAITDVLGAAAMPTFIVTGTLGMAFEESANSAFRDVLAQMRAGASGIRQLDLGGEAKYIAYSPLSEIGWSLALVAPVDELTAQSQQIAATIRAGTDRTVNSTLLTMAVFFLLAVVGTTVLSRRLTRPITALVAGTRAVAAGDLSVRIPVESRDELGVLARSFNQMIAEVAASRQRLETWNQTLEQQVQERTAQLAQAKEEAEHARAAAEEANRLKTQFLANMSHELRTPLNSIINFTRILGSGLRGPVSEAQQDYLNRVWQSGEHLLGLINDILDLSKIEAGRMDLLKEPVQLRELIQSVMATAAGLTREKPVELRQELDALLPVVQVDRTRIRQVLLNLLSNAAKFTEQGHITVRAAVQDAQVLISVMDTGIGIAEEHLPLVFEEFRQVDGSVNRRYEGTGLGLAICRKLIELHGGQIWVESQPGAGSSFSFSLPLQEREAPVGPELALPLVEHNGSGNGLTVLVVDDDDAAIEIVSTYLSRDGYTVYGLRDSRSALEQARRLKPAAIILDILMPHKDGWEILGAIRSDPELLATPVALYTIVNETKLGFYLGASAYLTKPINEEQLRATVARLVGRGAEVLVIDDDPNAREIIKQQVEQTGAYRVLTAAGGREGLACIEEHRPDLIILDLMMPDIDGFAVLEQLEQRAGPGAIPVIVLTAKDLTREEHAFLTGRVNGLLTKGASSADDLIGRMRTLLQPLADASSRLAHEPQGE